MFHICTMLCHIGPAQSARFRSCPSVRPISPFGRCPQSLCCAVESISAHANRRNSVQHCISTRWPYIFIASAPTACGKLDVQRSQYRDVFAAPGRHFIAPMSPLHPEQRLTSD
jgi:hypothetical protein